MLTAARHPALLERGRCALLVVDVQEAFRWHIPHFEHLVSQIRLLMTGAARLGVPIAWSEQYPRGLGSTVPELAGEAPAVGTVLEKLALSAFDAPGWQQLPVDVRDASQFIVVGIEAHICVRHTVLGMLAAGRDVHVPVDAVASGSIERRDAALAALEQVGARRSSVEQVLFDLLGEAGTPEFKDVQALLKHHAAGAT